MTKEGIANRNLGSFLSADFLLELLQAETLQGALALEPADLRGAPAEGGRDELQI